MPGRRCREARKLPDSRETEAVVARTRATGEREWTVVPLDLAWPRGIHSLSHVALPFPEDDPVYGAGDANRGASPLMLGALNLRGERGVFGVGMDQIMRLRHNPFFPYIEARIAERLDGGADQTGASSVR